MPSKYPRMAIPKDPSLKKKLDSLSDYAKKNGITRDSELLRRLIDEGYDSIRQRELRDALTVNAAHQDDSIAEAALKALVTDSDLG